MRAFSDSAALTGPMSAMPFGGGIVLHVLGCRSIQYGSFEDNLVSLARECSQRGLKSVFVYPEEPSVAAFPRDLGEAGGRIMVVADTDRGDAVGALAINRVIRSVRPRVVHAHFGRPGYLAVAMARAAGVPVVVLMKHHESWPAISRGHRWALRAVAAAADGILCVSPVVEDEVLAAGVPAGKTWLTPLGINTQRYAPQPMARARVREELGYGPDHRLALCVSHLRVPKGIDVLLDAWDIASAGRNDATLLLAGDGPLREELKAQAARLPCASRVRFLGVRQDVPRLLGACDLFVCPSLSEAGGLNIAEALSAGAPTVTTLVGVVRRLGDAGILVPVEPPGDAVALAHAISAALESEESRNILGIRARDYVVRNLSLNRATARLVDVYEGGTLVAGGATA